MPITDRVKMLREKSLNAKETLSSERAELLTAFISRKLDCSPRRSNAPSRLPI